MPSHPSLVGARLRRVAGPLLSAVVAVVALGSAALWFGGYRLQVVGSASMTPSIPTGALVVVEPVAIRDVVVGDVIAFTDPTRPGTAILHRVTGVTDDADRGRRLTTQGDANPDADPFEVGGAELQGREVATIPRAGVIGRLLASGSVAPLLVGVPVACWLGVLALDRRRATARRAVPLPNR